MTNRDMWPEDAQNEVIDLEMVRDGLRRMMLEQKKEIEQLKEEINDLREQIKSLEAELYNQQQFRGPNRDNW